MTDREKSILAYSASSWFALLGLSIVLLSHCQPSTDPKVAKAQTDFCKVRALYVATTGGQFDAPPGSARGRLEIAEDEFCAKLASK